MREPEHGLDNAGGFSPETVMVPGSCRFSVIIPICHGGALLKAALESLMEIDFEPSRFELIVAGRHDDSKSRSIVQSVKSFAGFEVTYLSSSRPARSGLLNQACNAARGRILAFADDDCIFHRDWLTVIEAAFSHFRGAGIVGGQDEHAKDSSVFNLALNSVFNSFLATGGLRRGTGVRVGKYYPKLWNMAVPRDVAFDVAIRSKDNGLLVFDESIRVHEDVELAERIAKSGRDIVYEPLMRIGHERDTTYLSFAYRNFKMAQVCRAHGIHTIPHICLSCLVISFPLIALSAALASPPFQWKVILPLCLYLIVLSISAFQGFRQTRCSRVSVLIPLLVLTLHLTRGLGFLWPAAKSVQRKGAD